MTVLVVFNFRNNGRRLIEWSISDIGEPGNQLKEVFKVVIWLEVWNTQLYTDGHANPRQHAHVHIYFHTDCTERSAVANF